MEKIRETIENAIKSIQEQQSYRKVELRDDLRLTKDLGFSSLDIAQLIALLELELEVDPFSQGFSISDIGTIGSLSNVYMQCIQGGQV
jgi:acyl carrier protein